MAMNSINTNSGALIALQNLNATNSALSETQSRINTGQRVSSAKDNGAIWAMAQNQRATSASLNPVKDSLQRGISTIDVAISAGETVSDLLTQMKEKALASSDTSLDAAARTALNNDFIALRDQITKAVNDAEFNGKNLLKTGSTSLAVLSNSAGTTMSVGAQIISPAATAGSIMTVLSTSSIGTVTTATAMIATVKTSIENVSASLAKLGTGSKQLSLQLTFTSKLQDSLDAGVGNLVDADLAKESAKLQALQTKQQLGIQALSIANGSSSSLLGLFR